MMPHSPPIKLRPRGSRKIRTQSPENPIPIQYGNFRSFDGTKIFYCSEGEGLPLVFCYGLVCSSLHWTYQIDTFRRTHRAIWFDYRAHHNSEVPKDLGSITVPNIATDLALLLDELEIQKTVLIAHSMGVNVALELYRLLPERVAGLVLSNGTSRRPLETMFHHNFPQTALQLMKRLFKSKPKLFRKLWALQKGNPLIRLMVMMGGFNPHLTAPADIDLYLEQVVDMDPAIFLQLIENYDHCDESAWLHTIKAPTLLLSGEYDHMTPPHEQELMNQLIPNSQLETIRYGSHCVQLDYPELVTAKIEKFLKEIGF